jgi:6,7-dimethyl-8-ribityllumazine synthase
VSFEGRRGLPTPDGTGLRIAVVCARFNDSITTTLLEGARDALTQCRVANGDVTVVWVPGAFEIPMVAKRLAKSGSVDAVVTLGAVIRGDTGHYDLVAGQCAAGVQQVSLETGIPVIFGVLTTETVEQALERANRDRGDKGAEVAIGAVETALLLRELG